MKAIQGCSAWRFKVSTALLSALVCIAYPYGWAYAAGGDPKDCEAIYSEGRFEDALPVCTRAAEAGHCESKANIAWLYVWGVATKEPARGLAWMKQAAECGSVRAQGNLGVMYAEGIGTEKSASEAQRWFSMAAEQGYAPALRHLSYTVQNAEKSSKYLLRAAELGDVQAYMELAEQRGWMNSRTGWVWLQRAARSGNSLAMYLLGQGMLSIYRVTNPEVIPTKLKWLKMAIEAGSVDAKCVLADHYFNYGATPQEHALAIPMYQEIAKLQNPQFDDNRMQECQVIAYENLARAYRDGRGVAKNAETSAQWRTRASEAEAGTGSRSSTYELALNYFDGEGVKKDPVKANQLLMLVRKDRPRFMLDEALFQLAKSHAFGRGTKKNPDKALEFLRESSYSKRLPYTDDVSTHDKSGWARLYEANVLLSGELGEPLQKVGKNLMKGLVDDDAIGKFPSKTLGAVIRDQGELLGLTVKNKSDASDAYSYIRDPDPVPRELPPLLPGEPTSEVWGSWAKQVNDKLKSTYPSIGDANLLSSVNIYDRIPSSSDSRSDLTIEIGIVDIGNSDDAWVDGGKLDTEAISRAVDSVNTYVGQCGIHVAVAQYVVFRAGAIAGPIDANWEGYWKNTENPDFPLLKRSDMDFRFMPASSRPRIVIWNEGERSERDWVGMEIEPSNFFGGTGAIAIYASNDTWQDPGRSHIPSTLAHELGHLLGLPHAKHFKPSIMSYVYEYHGNFGLDGFRRFDESECRIMRQSPYLHRTHGN